MRIETHYLITMDPFSKDPMNSISDNSNDLFSEELNKMEVRDHNIEAITEVTGIVQSTLGPLGMDKMLVDANGNVVVTNDGVTVLQEMAIEEPIAKIVLKVANQQIKKRSDGTTTATILTGRLLRAALSLLEDGVYASTVADGFDFANQELKEKMVDMAVPIDITDSAVLTRVARNALNGQGTGLLSEQQLAEIAVEAVEGVTADGRVDLNAIKIDKITAGTGLSTRVHNGALLTGDPAHPSMPTDVSDAKILTVNDALEPATGKRKEDWKMEITSAEQLEQFETDSVARAAATAERIQQLGVDAIFHVKASDDELVRQLANRDILVVKVSAPKLRFLKKVLDNRMVPDLERATDEDEAFGYGDIRSNASEGWMNVTGEDHPGVTISIRSSVKQLIDELHRGITDATDAIGTAVDDGHVLPGGGATEAELAAHLRAQATSVSDKRQLVIAEFANAIEEIPRQLARSAGMDEVDVITELRNEHAVGNEYAGVDPIEKTITDMMDTGVVDTVSVKATALDLATETSITITRIDGIVPTSSSQIRTAPSDKSETESET